jgi:hypothetical protein
LKQANSSLAEAQKKPTREFRKELNNRRGVLFPEAPVDVEVDVLYSKWVNITG